MVIHSNSSLRSQGSIRSEWQKDMNLSVEKIARMKGISLQRGLAGVLILVMGICGIFLFSLMSADDIDESVVRAVGYTGATASLGQLLSEIYSNLKAQRMRIEKLESGSVVTVEQQPTPEHEELVEEVSQEREEEFIPWALV